MKAKLLRFVKSCLISIVLVFLLGQIIPRTHADDLQDQINSLQAKISDLQGQEKTLSSQIAVFDDQIKLTTLKIAETNKEISDLTLDIDTTNKKIGNIESSLNGLTKVLLNRIVETYIAGSTPPFQVLIASNSVSDFVERANYLRIAQAHDKKLIYDTVQAKNDYSNQKNIFQDKKKQVLALEAQLESYNAELDQEKKDKAALLAATKNDEATYQAKLQTALAEQRAIQAISAGGGSEVSVGHINEGDHVGTIINSASPCSTGAHLHFEVHKNGGLQDPSTYLSGKSVTWDNSPDGSFGFSGSWSWPIDDPVYIYQGYGMTSWARSGYYGGGPHTGIDMYSGSSLNVKAVKSGNLYRGSISCGGGQLLYGRVDQGDGIDTYYLHTIP